jgi:hypothetical protein
VHLIQRGNNRQVCLGSAEDHAVYAKWLDEYARESRVAVHTLTLNYDPELRKFNQRSKLKCFQIRKRKS